MVMGILTEKFGSAAITVFARSALKKSYFLPIFFAVFREIYYGGDRY
jgi:hypothetical protein